MKNSEQNTDEANSFQYDEDGFDCFGYDKEGYNADGLDCDGYLRKNTFPLVTNNSTLTQQNYYPDEDYISFINKASTIETKSIGELKAYIEENDL